MGKLDREGQTWVPPSTSTLDVASAFDSRPDRDWLNPIAMSALKRAVERKENTVWMNGHEMKIEYGFSIKLPVSQEKRETVRLTRKDGNYAPMGYVALKTIADFQFEEK